MINLLECLLEKSPCELFSSFNSNTVTQETGGKLP